MRYTMEMSVNRVRAYISPLNPVDGLVEGGVVVQPEAVAEPQHGDGGRRHHVILLWSSLEQDVV